MKTFLDFFIPALICCVCAVIAMYMPETLRFSFGYVVGFIMNFVLHKIFDEEGE